MTVYYVTIGIVGYFLVMAELTRSRLGKDSRTTPTSALSKFFVLAASATLVVVAGLRWRVGTDYGGYARFYEAFQDSFLADLRSYNEPGIKGLAVLASWLVDDYGMLIFLASAITIGLMLSTIAKHSPAISFSVLLFILTGLWHGTFNGVRQYLACAIVFAGHRFIIARKPLAFGLVVLGASLFHVSALAMLGLYFVPRRRLALLGFLGVFALVLAALYSSDALLGAVESVKGTDLTIPYVTQEVNPWRIAVGLAPVALYAWAVRDEDTPAEWFYRNMAIVHAAIVVAVSWSAYLTRFSIYTAAFIPLFLPRLVNFPNPVVTRLARVGVVVLYAAFWYVEVSSSVDLNDFKWVLQREPL